MVYYLKYRPQTIDDLSGQEHVVETLKNALAGDKLSHAYLFTGPRGVGKTSTARILAKMVNCPKGGDDCEICQSISDGSNLDLIEIDAASNRGIDDIRDLREKVKLSPTSLKKKVYIIDEVHMLTTEAFNALLKTLEEPPEHVLFILATTEVHKVPATILSRVQRIDFNSASAKSLKETLKGIAEKEKIKVSDGALDLIVKKADGSFRDGVKLLDQLSSSGEVTEEIVGSLLRSGKNESVTNLLSFLADKKTPEALSLIIEEADKGVNLKDLCVSVMEKVRLALLLKHNMDQVVGKEISKEEVEMLKDLAGKLSVTELVLMLESFQKAYEKSKFSALPSLPLEVAVIESAQGPVITQQRVEPVVIVTQSVVEEEEPGFVNPHEGAIHGEAKKVDKVEDVEELPTDTEGLGVLKDKWTYILETIRPYNYSLEALLKQVKVASLKEGSLVLKVPYSFHQRILETPRNRDLLEGVLTEVLGKNTKVVCMLEPRPVRIEELQNVEVAADDEIIKVAAEIFNSEVS